MSILGKFTHELHLRLLCTEQLVVKINKTEIDVINL